MSIDGPPGGRDYTDDELIAMMMGSEIETDVGEITFRSQKLSLTVA
jgi:hypothetical protein